MSLYAMVVTIIAVIEGLYILILHTGDAVDEGKAEAQADKDVVGLKELWARIRDRKP